MAFGKKNNGSGFGNSRGSFGGFSPKTNGAKTTENNGSRFGSSADSPSVGTKKFGAKTNAETNKEGSKRGFRSGFGNSESGDNSNTTPSKSSNNSMPVLTRTDIRDDEKPSEIKRTKIVTFSNVRWQKFDHIRIHPSGAEYNEPCVHVIANRDNIEFHGYNVSEMDEGVYYIINRNDDFEIECDVDTTHILPHPGGYFYISFGIITAMINQDGGKFLLNNTNIAQVGSSFRMKLSLTESGKYEVFINGIKKGEQFQSTSLETKIVFGFKHDSHNCKRLSHAYVNRIKMKQSKGLGSGSFGPK